MTVDVRIALDRVRQEMPFTVAELPALYRQHFGVHFSRSTAYLWFQRGSMPLPRFLQLLYLIKIKSKSRPNVWTYIDVTEH